MVLEFVVHSIELVITVYLLYLLLIRSKGSSNESSL